MPPSRAGRARLRHGFFAIQREGHDIREYGLIFPFAPIIGTCYNAPKLGTTMLRLPDQWRLINGGAVARHLANQVGRRSQQLAVVTSLIRASLELMTKTWPRPTRRPLEVADVSHFCWRVLDLYYYYLPDDCDRAIRSCIKLCRTEEVIVVAPDRYLSLKESLLDAVLGDHRRPSVLPVDFFVSWRTTWQDRPTLATRTRHSRATPRLQSPRQPRCPRQLNAGRGAD